MKKNRIIINVLCLLFISLILTSVLCAAESQKHNYKPVAGYVPDKETAIKIAVAVWSPIYGKKKIEKEEPYKATLKDGIWYENPMPLRRQKRCNGKKSS